MKTLIPIFTAMLFSNNIIAQLDLVWDATYGSTGDDKGRDMIYTEDGHIVVVGFTNSQGGEPGQGFGGYDGWVVKLDEQGDTVWTSRIGALGGDYFLNVLEDFDGNILVSGYTTSDTIFNNPTHGSEDFLIVKLDADGNFLWGKIYGSDNKERAHDMVQLANGNYKLIGYIQEATKDVSQHYGSLDVWLITLDQNGNLLTEKNFGGTGYDFGRALIAEGNTVVFCAQSISSDNDLTGIYKYGAQDYWVVKVDENDNIIWQNNFGGGDVDIPYSITQTPDGGYAISGSSESDDGLVINHHGTDATTDIWVVKISAEGELEWANSYGGTLNDYGDDILVIADGRLLIGGFTNSDDGDVSNNYAATLSDFWLLELDADGNLLSEQNFGGTGSDVAYAIAANNDWEIAVAGYSNSDDHDISDSTQVEDFWVIRLGAPVGLGTKSNKKPYLIAYPNPTTGIIYFIDDSVKNSFEGIKPPKVNLELKIFDLHGKAINSKPYDSYPFKVDFSSYPKGLYTVKLTNKQGETEVKKIIVK